MMSDNAFETYHIMHMASAPVQASPQDMRDYVFGSKAADNRTTDFQWELAQLPLAVDLKPFTEAVEDQGDYGSCVGHGVASTAETMFMRVQEPVNLSPMYAYYNGRRRAQELWGEPITDGGTYTRAALSAAGKWGLARETAWPYQTSPVNQQPSEAAYADGATRLVTRYETCGATGRDMIADIKVAVASGYPVVFGVPLVSAFYRVKGPLSTHHAQYPSDGSDLMKDPNYVGNHCMHIIGYDDGLQAFIVENSWGPGWADGGFVALSYEHIRANAFDCYVMREVDGLRFEIPSQFYPGGAVEPIVVPTPVPVTPVDPAPVVPVIPFVPPVPKDDDNKNWVWAVVAAVVVAIVVSVLRT
jgi:C1A family cysteine protease